MKYTQDRLEEMSDDELDHLVTQKVGGFKPSDFSKVSGNYHKGKPSDEDYKIGLIRRYCNSWTHMGLIIQRKRIDLYFNSVDGDGAYDTISGALVEHKNPLRAAVIVYLLMEEP